MVDGDEEEEEEEDEVKNGVVTVSTPILKRDALKLQNGHSPMLNGNVSKSHLQKASELQKLPLIPNPSHIFKKASELQKLPLIPNP